VHTAGLHALNEVEHDQDEQNRGQQDPQGVQGAYWSRLLWHVVLMPREACWREPRLDSLAPVARVYPSPTTCLLGCPCRRHGSNSGWVATASWSAEYCCSRAPCPNLARFPASRSPYRLGDVHERQPGTSAPTPGGYQIRQASKRQRLPSSH